MMREFAPAKINLFLHVDAPDASGYHPLRSLVGFADVGDELEFAPADDLKMQITGPFADGLTADDNNLVLQAARALRTEINCKRGAHISLTKNLPLASGIGGGSADAAATLRGLNQLWDCALDETHLVQLGAQIGSDVPVCVRSRITIMEGRGEILREARPEKVHGLLVNPGVAVSTASVFAAYDAGVKSLAHGRGKPHPDIALERNDLAPAAISQVPEIGEILQALAECKPDWARMCGSGATCLGAFPSSQQAREAKAVLQSANPDWWICCTRIQ